MTLTAGNRHDHDVNFMIGARVCAWVGSAGVIAGLPAGTACCAGHAAHTVGNNPPKVDPAAPACPSKSLVESKLGLSLDGDAVETRANPRVNCSYKGKRLSDNKVTTVFIGSDGASGPGPFADYRKQEADQGYPLADRAGLGDGAFTWTVTAVTSTTNNMVTYKGSLRIYLGSTATLDQEADLAVAIWG
jgi:hypothetical protein